MTWIPLSRSKHAAACYSPRVGYSHVSGRMAVGVLLAELPKLLSQYVLAFAELDGNLSPVAVLGLDEGQNLYLHDDGRWLSSVVPAALRGYPFALVPTEHDERTLVLDSAHLSDEGEGEPLFDGTGNLVKSVSDNLTFLNKCADNSVVTRNATKALETAGVITPWTLSVTVNDAQKTLGGLYRIDEAALNRLPADAYANLQGAPMALAYAQLLSMHQREQLKMRAELRSKAAHQQEVSRKEMDLFDSGDDDNLLDFSSYVSSTKDRKEE